MPGASPALGGVPSGGARITMRASTDSGRPVALSAQTQVVEGGPLYGLEPRPLARDPRRLERTFGRRKHPGAGCRLDRGARHLEGVAPVLFENQAAHRTPTKTRAGAVGIGRGPTIESVFPRKALRRSPRSREKPGAGRSRNENGEEGAGSLARGKRAGA